VGDMRVEDGESRYRERVLECLERLSKDPVVFRVIFDTVESRIDFSRIFPLTTLSTVQAMIHTMQDIHLPHFPTELHLRSDSETDAFEELDLWAGLLFNKCSEVLSPDSHVDPFISTCSMDPSKTTFGTAHVTHILTPVHPRRILQFITQISLGTIVCIKVAGNPEAPVTWTGNPNRTDAHADSAHGYSLFLQPSTDACILMQYATTNLRNL